jgi:hypothetical protein
MYFQFHINHTKARANDDANRMIITLENEKNTIF